MTWGAAAQDVRAAQLQAAATAGDLRYDSAGRLVHRCHFGEQPGRLILATSDDAEIVTGLVTSGAPDRDTRRRAHRRGAPMSWELAAQPLFTVAAAVVIWRAIR